MFPQSQPWMNLRDGRMAWFNTKGGFVTTDQAKFSDTPNIWWGWRQPGNPVFPPEPGWQIPGQGLWGPGCQPPQWPPPRPAGGPGCPSGWWPPGCYDCRPYGGCGCGGFCGGGCKSDSCGCFTYLLTHAAPWCCYWQDQQWTAWMTGQQPWPASQSAANSIMASVLPPVCQPAPVPA
jgi:hypothetical protein